MTADARSRRSTVCGADHCITCGGRRRADEGRRASTATGAWRSAPTRRARGAAVETALVEPVVPGDALLVHAGVAIAALDGARALHEVRRRVPRPRARPRRWPARSSPPVEPGRHYKLMEVCGGHTHTIYRHGIERPAARQRRAGARPGLPGLRDPDGPGRRRHRHRADEPGVIFTCFGDMMRVPGARGQPARGQGARAPTCAWSTRRSTRCGSPSENPDREVVFFAIGFETTAPSTALTLLQAREPRASRTSRASATTSRSCRRSRRSSSRPTCGSTASSARATSRPWSAAGRIEFVPADYGKPLVIAGFEPLDILQAIAMMLRADRARAAARSRTSTRASCRDEGNPRGARGAGRGVRAAAALRVARPRLHLAERAEAARRATPTSTPSCASRCPACGSPTPRPASAARC